MDRFRGIQRVLWITLVLNLIPAAAKLAVGYWTGSLSVVADGFDSVFDSASNVIGLVGIYLASRPADKDHPYGHRKAENLTTLVIAMLLFLTMWELIKSGVQRLLNPALINTTVNLWSFGALLVSIAIHGIVVWYEAREGRRLKSDVLIGDARHTRADIFVSLSVIGGLVAVRLGFPLADPILALIIALVIGKIGIDIIRESSPSLLDQVMMPPDRAGQIALSVPGVVSYHRVRSRGHESAVYADLHIRVDPAMSTQQAHAIAHEVQRRIMGERPEIQDVTVHVEPEASRSPQQVTESITVQLRRLADGLGLGVHSVWAYELGGGYYVEVHLETDGSSSLREAHALASTLEERARAEVTHLTELTTHIEPRGQLSQSAVPGMGKQEVAEAVQRVLGEVFESGDCHHVQVYAGDRGWTIALHCLLPGDVPVAQAHRTSTQVERRLRDNVPGLDRVVIHTEPRDA